MHTPMVKFRLFRSITLMFATALGAVGLFAQTALTELTFNNSGDRLANTGSGGTTFANTGVSFTTGQNGDAASFDGSSYLTASSAGLTTGMTISFWMKTNSYGGTDPNGNWYEGSGLVDAEQAGTHPDWGVSLWQGKIAFGIGAGDQHMGLGEAGSTMISNASVNTNNWVFVAATWDTSGTMNIYIDGVLDSTYTNVNRTDPRDASYTYYIGADSGAFDGNHPSKYYTGLLDQVAIYSTALNGTQISNLYTASAVPEPATYAALAGIAALGFAAYRRRR